MTITGLRSRPNVLHLVGSATSEFYHDLSVVYAREALLPRSVNHRFAVVSPEGSWQHGPSLDRLSAACDLGRFVAEVGHVDLVVPYMFDPIGMTSYRSLFEDVLRVPVVGSRAEVTAVATDKALTKQLLASAGVPVPASIPIDEPDEITYPVIVKPNLEDNSCGLTLVERADELAPAIERAEAYGAGLLVEEYVPGRELRVAVVDLGSELYVPAMIEYGVSGDHPIRELEHKLRLGSDGNPKAQATTAQVPMICPAPVDTDLRDELSALARRAHRALGCRDYSLFDVRVDPDGGPRVLEAGLFWTFGPPSMISRMVAADGRDPETVSTAVWANAMSRSFDDVRAMSTSELAS